MEGKNLLISAGIILGILIVASLNSPSTGNAVSNPGQKIQTLPLNQAQIQTFSAAVQNSGILNDIPKKDPVAINFYDFEGDKRIWREGFVLGEGEPKIQIIMHSKYIDEMNSKPLCDVIREANRNGDLDYYTDLGKASLLLKYSSLLKYKDCL